jgi:uncharacterized membrane protein
MAKKRSRSKRPPRRRTRNGAESSVEAATAASPRSEIVDAARGFAIVMMIAYHFCFDLTYFGWAGWPMLADARWIAWRTTIVASFLVLVGVSLALRDDRERRTGGAGWLDRAFVRRWLQVAGAAALVTAGSVALFPDRYIYFGVLHFVAVALWLCRRAPRRPRAAIVAAIVAVCAGLLFSNEAFDPRSVDWIGFATVKPPTEDYVPLFPWLGAVLLGCGLGGIRARHERRTRLPVARVWNALPSPLRRILATLGRWSLTTYLVHQPLMLGTMAVVKRLG